VAAGQVALAGSVVIGAGSLAYYGLGLSQAPGAVDKALAWPQHVRDRVRLTYSYLIASVGVTAAFAMAILRLPVATYFTVYFYQTGGFLALVTTMMVLSFTKGQVQSIPYSSELGRKHAMWLAYCSMVSAFLVPMCLSGPMAMQVLLGTGGMAAALSTVAVCAPSDEFLTIGGPLAMLSVVVFGVCASTYFMPASAVAINTSVLSFATYGGIILFAGLLLFDTQRVIKMAEEYPEHPAEKNLPPFDPMTTSLGLFMKTVQLFVFLSFARDMSRATGMMRK